MIDKYCYWETHEFDINMTSMSQSWPSGYCLSEQLHFQNILGGWDLESIMIQPRRYVLVGGCNG